MNEFWDRLGISASILCVAHCLLTPALVAFSPMMGQFLSDKMFHIVIVLLVIPVAVLALWRGYRLHAQKRILVIGAVGIALVLSAIAVDHGDRVEIVLMVIAGVTLSLAHFLNLKGCQTPQCPEGNRHHHHDHHHH